MNLTEKLQALAASLEDIENEALLVAEELGEEELAATAAALVSAADIIKKTATEIAENQMECYTISFNYWSGPKSKANEPMHPAYPSNTASKSFTVSSDSLEEALDKFNKFADTLKEKQDTEKELETKEANLFSPEAIEKLAQLATSLDESDNEELQKQASVLDELLLTIAASPDEVKNLKERQDRSIDEIKKKYNSVNEELNKQIKTKEAVEAIKKSPVYKEYRSLEAPLSTRYSPDHPGVPVIRVGDDVWQDALTGKLYDFKSGFTTEQGNKVPGGNVSSETNMDQQPLAHTIFDDREGRLNSRLE